MRKPLHCPCCNLQVTYPRNISLSQYNAKCDACNQRYIPLLLDKTAIEQAIAMIKEAPGWNASKGIALLILSLVDKSASFGVAESMAYFDAPSKFFSPKPEHMRELVAQLINDWLSCKYVDEFNAAVVEIKLQWQIIDKLMIAATEAKERVEQIERDLYFDRLEAQLNEHGAASL